MPAHETFLLVDAVTGFKDLVIAKANKDKIQAIIREEFSHIVALNLDLTVL